MQKSLTFDIFQTPAGKPTCCFDYNKQFCKFLGTRRLGVEDICLYPCDRAETALFRDKNGLGYLIPHENCPFWKDS